MAQSAERRGARGQRRVAAVLRSCKGVCVRLTCRGMACAVLMALLSCGWFYRMLYAICSMLRQAQVRSVRRAQSAGVVPPQTYLSRPASLACVCELWPTPRLARALGVCAPSEGVVAECSIHQQVVRCEWGVAMARHHG